MAINVTDSGASIKLEITTDYFYAGVSIKTQTRYIDKSRFEVKVVSNDVILLDKQGGISDELRFLFSDITTPAGATATIKGANIEALKDTGAPISAGAATSANQSLQLAQETTTAANTVEINTKISNILTAMTDQEGSLWGYSDGASPIENEVACESGDKIGSIVISTNGDYNGTTGTIELLGSNDNDVYTPVLQDDNVTPMAFTLNGPLDFRTFVLKAVVYKYYRVSYLPGDTTNGGVSAVFVFKK